MCLSELVKSGFACEEEKPNAIHALNSPIFGITETMLSRVKGDEYATPQDLVDATINSVSNTILSEVMGYMTNQKLVNSVIDHQFVGYQKDGTKPASNRWGGVYGQLRNDIAVKLQVMSVTIEVDYTGTISLKFINITTGEVVTENVAVVVNTPKTITPNVEFSSGMQRLKWAIGYDKNGIVSRHTRIEKDCLDCSVLPKCGPYVWVYGAEFNENGGAVKRIGHNSGLSVEFSITCDHEPLLCTNKTLIATPFAYKVAAELMAYALTTGRYNDEDEKKFDKKLGWFAAEYDRHMRLIVPRISVPNNECSSCFRSFGTKMILP